MGRMRIGELLRAMKAVTEEQIKEALAYQKNNPNVKLGRALKKLGFASDAALAKALAKQFGLSMVKLSNANIAKEVLETIPRNVVEEYRILPVLKNGKAVTVAISDPLDIFEQDQLRFVVGKEMNFVVCPKDELDAAIAKFYGTSEADYDKMYQEMTQSAISFRGDEMPAADAGGDDDESEEGVIKLVNLIIGEAVKRRASDIHVEPMESRLRIRYRVDGDCAETQNPPKALQSAIIARMKIMAGMNIAEKRRTQDGRIKIRVQGREIDLRVNCLPTNHGESIVMRILDKEKALVDLEDLGFFAEDYERFQRLIKRPNGVVLVTGPTGSGKTTTLYAALKKINKPNIKIITAEHPIEYHLDGINQCQVRHEIGLDFSKILRAMLRQAPNVILVGEIRDRETAKIAIESALTGHLVFSTLHTNDAPGAITRLIDMDVKPFLVASAITAVMAQRLVKVLCKHCKTPYTLSPKEISGLGLTEEQLATADVRGPAGCPECGNQGYRGRLGIYELMEMTTEIREMTFHKAPLEKIRAQALRSNMLSLQQDGIRKVLNGITTAEQVLSITHRQDLEL